MMGHLQDCSSLHDPPGRASSLGRPNPVSYNNPRPRDGTDGPAGPYSLITV